MCGFTFQSLIGEIRTIESLGLRVVPHNPKAVSSTLTPATKCEITGRAQALGLFYFMYLRHTESASF